MLADKSFPLRSKDAYSDRLMKVSYSRRGGLLRLRTGRLATSRISFLASRGDWEPREVVEAEGIAPSAGALGRGHAALAAPLKIYGLNGSAPLTFGAPNSVPLFGVSVFG